jgi:hypothetical protein
MRRADGTPVMQMPRKLYDELVRELPPGSLRPAGPDKGP